MRAKACLVAIALSALVLPAVPSSAQAEQVDQPNQADQTAGTKWPGGSTVTVADGSDVFGTNLSGLSFQDPDVLWAVRNGPSTLYRLVPDDGGGKWSPDTSGGWESGKSLTYADGKGEPDAEGVSATPDGIFVSTERDGDDDGTSLLKIVRYDGTSSASSLKATAEWDLTPDLPSVGDNDGLEAISWVPDTFLTKHGFYDEKTKKAYDPATYPGHGSGLYFTGLEANGTVYAYALDQEGDGFTRVATIKTGASTIMDLTFEPEAGRLWAVCDDTCQGSSTTLEINGQGKFAATATYDRPSGMADLNNEGFAIAPQTACSAGAKPVLWSDDGNEGGHALRSGTLPCV
ncbi:hypothetical protein ACGFSB_21270 [Streptomyces sp. NPDC048441]|uniref:hypothetical protein n=1 Tax=Streptomyces sp. NPDC048441 TaxID=3365552 RepID=UPI003723F57D